MLANSELYQLLTSADVNCEQASIEALKQGAMIMTKIGDYDLVFGILGENELLVSANIIKGINDNVNNSKVLSALSSALPFASTMKVNLYLCSLTQDITEGKELMDSQILFLDGQEQANGASTNNALKANEFFNLKLELIINVSKHGLEQQQELVSEFCSLVDYLKERYLQAY